MHTRQLRYPRQPERLRQFVYVHWVSSYFLQFCPRSSLWGNNRAGTTQSFLFENRVVIALWLLESRYRRVMKKH
jgi:hypothetical protein